MNVASRELCEELYRLSRWGRLDDSELNWYFKFGKHLGDDERWSITGNEEMGEYPAYDLGYLLRKLPAEVEEFSETYHLTYELLLAKYEANEFHADYWWNDDLRFNMVPSGTPEDALVTLAIELFKQGVLTREAA